MNSRLLALILTAGLVVIGAYAWAQSDSQSTPPAAGDTGAAPPSDTQTEPIDNNTAPPSETGTAPTGNTPSPDQTAPAPTAQGATSPPAAGPSAASGQPTQAAQAPVPTGPPPTPPNAVLVMMGLDKITGRPTRIVARLNQPVHFATFTITARYCYSTPPSETPETSAFLQIDDHRPDQAERRVFSGWMYASSPGLNGVQHPLYDVWVISCSANAPGQAPPTVAAAAPVKVRSPDATDNEGVAPLPEGAGQ